MKASDLLQLLTRANGRKSDSRGNIVFSGMLPILFNELKISAIATRAGLNPNLVQQYVSGNKKTSESQAKKLERAVHELARELKQITLL